MKTRIKDRILAMILAMAMIFGMTQGLMLHALGAESDIVTIDMSQETISSVYWTGETTKRFAVTMTNALEKAADIKGKGIFRAVEDGISGVWLGETKLEDTANVGVAYGSDGVNWYIGSGWTELIDENGTVLTVRGTFEKTISGVTYQLKMPTVQFQYNAETAAGMTKWSIVEEQKENITYDLTNATVTGRNNTDKDRVWANIADTAVDTSALKGKSLTAADEQSGVWADDDRIAVAQLYLDKNTPNAWRIYVGLNISESVVTVKGTFALEETDAIYTVILPEMQFEYKDGKWIVKEAEIPTVTIDLTGAELTVNANSKQTDRVFLDVNNVTADTSLILKMTFTATDEASGIWVGDTKATAGTLYYYQDKGKDLIRVYVAQSAADSILKVKGSFTAVSEEGTIYKLILPEIKMEYIINAWALEGTTIKPTDPAIVYDLTKDSFISRYNSEKDRVWIGLKDAKTDTEALKGMTFIAADSGSGVWADGELCTAATVYRDKTTNAWRIYAGKSVDTATVTIKGTFEAAQNGKHYKIILPEISFQYTADAWYFAEDLIPIIPAQTGAVLTLDTQTAYGGSESGIYLNTDDIFPTDKTWATRIRAVPYDAGSGVFYNGQKLNASTICRYTDGKIYLSLASAGVQAKDKDSVTIKGTFAMGKIGVSYQEVTFYYNGQEWGTTYTAPKPVTYTKIEGTTVHPVTTFKTNPNRWVVYINVSDMLPGEIDAMRFEGLHMVVNGQEMEVSVLHSHEHTLCFRIDEMYLPQNAQDGIKITLKAGKALAGNKYSGIELVKDFSFYTFKGELTEQTIVSDTTWKEFNVNKLLRTRKFLETGKQWQFHLVTMEGVEYAQSTRFLQLPIEINGETCQVTASVDSGYFLIRIPDSILPGTTKQATITIKAGAEAVGNGGRDGIRFKEDWTAYIYNGVISEVKFDNVITTETKVAGLQKVLEQATSYGIYLRMSCEIPGTPWYEYYDDFVFCYNGQQMPRNLTIPDSTNNRYLYFSVDKTVVPEAKDGDMITIKAGTEANCGGYRIVFTDEYNIIYEQGVWSAYVKSDVTVPNVTGRFWEQFRFAKDYIPMTEDGTVKFAGTDVHNTITTMDSYMDYTMKFRIKKSIAEEVSSPFRVILRGNPISEGTAMTHTLLNGYVISFSTNKVTDKETEEEHYGCSIMLWKNGENVSLMDSYCLHTVTNNEPNPYFKYDEYYNFEISTYNVTETCVCIELRVNDKLYMRYYDEAGSDPFDPAVNSGKFAVIAIAPATIDEEVVELDTVIAEKDTCTTGEGVRVAATYPSVIKDAEFLVDKEGASVKDGLFKADKAGTYTVSCIYKGKELKTVMIKVEESEDIVDIGEDGSPLITLLIIIAVIAVAVAATGTVVVLKKKKGMQKHEDENNK